jgi:sugar/nucleoside kinase (ribokinase family)
MAPLVAVIGDALLDVHVVPSEPVRPGGDVPAAVRVEPGGQGANLAVRLARAGMRVRLTAAIGADDAGSILRAALAAEGVELHDLGAPVTGTIVVLRDASGDRTMLSQRAAFAARLDAASSEGADWLVISGYVILEPDARLTTWPDSIERRAVVGCSLGQSQAAAWGATVAGLRVHLLVLNRDEARTLADAGIQPGELADVAVVTHPAGAATTLGGHEISVAAPAGAAAIDTTGAGDAFAARLVASLADGPWPPEAERVGRAMAEASELATAVTRAAGAQARVASETGARLDS